MSFLVGFSVENRKETMRILKLLLHYNKEDLTRNVLKQHPDALVIDAASDTPFQHDNVLHLHENVGFTRHWNQALSVINLDDFDAVALLTNDIVLSPEAFNAAVQRLESIPRAGAIHVSTNSPHNHMRQWKGRDYTVVPYVELVAPIIRTEVLKQLLPFDERFLHGWGLDSDLGWQIRRLGYSNLIEHTVTMQHLEHMAYRANLDEYKARAGKEMTEGLSAKYGPNWSRDLYHMIGLTMVIYNEAHRLEENIEHHRRHVDEIVIYVQESTDGTEELARKLADRVLYGPCKGYSEGDRLHASLACGSWWQILVDADEFLTDELLNDLREITHVQEGGYRLGRRLFLDGKMVWEGDHHYRLYQRDAVKFLDELHTEPQPTKKVLTLPYISINHIKSMKEQITDELNYEQIINTKFRNHPTRNAKLALNVHLADYRAGKIKID